MSETLNANPTIRSATDLPSRRRQTDDSGTGHRPLGLLASAVPDAAYLPDPFSPRAFSDADSSSSDDDVVEPIDEQEIYDLIASITDPEHPLTLASLSVVNLPDVHLKPLPPPSSHLTLCTVEITPTITHCSLATVIGLGVRVRLEQSLPPRFRVDVRIKEGTHSTADQVTRQLGDKERVAAALENDTLMGVIKKMLEGCEGGRNSTEAPLT